MRRTLLTVILGVVALVPPAPNRVQASPPEVEGRGKTFRIYETLAGSDELVILEFRDRKKPKLKRDVRVSVGRSPTRAVVDPVGEQFVLVTNSKDKTVSRVDISGSQAARAPQAETLIPVGKEPRDVVITPDGGHAFVANFKSKSMSVIDLAANRVTQTVKVGKEPIDLSMDPDGEFVAVANHKSRSVMFVKIADAIAGRLGSPQRATVRDKAIKVGGKPESVSAYRLAGARTAKHGLGFSGARADGMMMAEAVSSTHRTIVGLGGVLFQGRLAQPCLAVLRDVPVPGAIVRICLNQAGQLVVEGFHPLQTEAGFQKPIVLLSDLSNVPAEGLRLYLDPVSELVETRAQIAMAVSTGQAGIARTLTFLSFDSRHMLRLVKIHRVAG